MSLDAILFYVFAVVAVASALVVVAQRNPTYSAFALIVTMASLSAIFGLLGSPFIAVLQVVVYAGAIMVLFVFVLMLLNVKTEMRQDTGGSPSFRWAAVGLGVLLAVQMGVVLVRATREGPGWAAGFDASARKVAQVLFSPQYLYVFEATSILIVAALVGSIALARRSGLEKTGPEGR
ncbi:MAG TPA: NADH-quinone oxidoreductase subunit J [Vicinamibacteria bacterium]|nr:NADH-quinone oxidoreductase subunit J [Vicinamibacteria bacterium]